MATVDDPSTRQPLRPIPYSIPAGRLHGGLSQLRWLGPERLVFLAEAVIVFRPCQICPLDTLRSGLDAVWLATNEGAPAAPQAIAGTEFASGVSPGSTPDEVYYTLNGDPRVYRTQISTGGVALVHDFGSSGFARDVHVVGNRMAVIVGGRVAFTADPSFGPTQWDSGGVVHVINLQDGSDVTLDVPEGLSRRPQLSPSGSAVVAEVYPIIVSDLVPPDTIVGQNGDLYRFDLP